MLTMAKFRIIFVLGMLAVSTPTPAYQNLSGVWGINYDEDYPDRVPGPELGDYAGLPINDAARMRADTYDPSLLTLQEYQCRFHPSDYVIQHAAFRITELRDQVTQELIALEFVTRWGLSHRYIWMDGRPHPPENAKHTIMGFSTGEWEGDNLIVTTTHLSNQGYIRRNGVPRSNEATLVEYFVRHGNQMTWSQWIDDPAYLEEPFFRNRDYYYDPQAQWPPFPCETVEEVTRPEGDIPHFLPGQNPALTEFAERRRIPYEATRGGAETMYPEYMHRLESMPLPPRFDEQAQE